MTYKVFTLSDKTGTPVYAGLTKKSVDARTNELCGQARQRNAAGYNTPISEFLRIAYSNMEMVQFETVFESDDKDAAIMFKRAYVLNHKPKLNLRRPIALQRRTK